MLGNPVERHLLPNDYGHVAIIRDKFADGTPMFSIELYRTHDHACERIRVYDRLKTARKHLLDIHAGVCALIHMQARDEREARDPDEVKAEAVEADMRAKGWVTEAEKYGSGSGVVHPDGHWAPSFTAIESHVWTRDPRTPAPPSPWGGE